MMRICFVLLFLSGCSAMSRKECENADWISYGERDASFGQVSNYPTFLKHCSDHRITPDKKIYEKGYKKGLITFCTYQNGYLSGNEGKALIYICPKELERAYLKGYGEGKRSFDQKEALIKEPKK